MNTLMGEGGISRNTKIWKTRENNTVYWFFSLFPVLTKSNKAYMRQFVFFKNNFFRYNNKISYKNCAKPFFYQAHSSCYIYFKKELQYSNMTLDSYPSHVLWCVTNFVCPGLRSRSQLLRRATELNGKLT